MLLRPVSSVVLLCLSCPGLFAADSKPKTPVRVEATAGGFVARGDQEIVEVTLCSDAIVHVRAYPASGVRSYPKPWLLPEAGWCHAPEHTLEQGPQYDTLRSSGLRVKVSKEFGNLEFLNADGQTLLKERQNVPHTYSPAQAKDSGLFHCVARFSPNKTEGFYGLGQHQSGQFNYRGATIELGQNNTDVAIPVLVSSAGYGVVWNTPSFTYVDNRFQLELSFDSLASEGVDYYVLNGPSMDQVIHHYREMSGSVPMLPRWSYGFIQSKDRYKSLDEMLTIAQRYRNEHIPFDTIVQDWYWWTNQGDPVFNANYGDVARSVAQLHALNAHTMISAWAQLSTESNTYKSMLASGQLLGETHVYDASNPAAADTYWSSLLQPLFHQGWDSFWLDSAEPNEFWPHGEDAILRGKTLHIGPGDAFTNVYPLLHNEGVQQRWKQETGDKRVFLLTRSAFLGSQRVGDTVWSGDIFSSFRDLKHQVAAGLNFSLSGLPYWTTDIGGYWPVAEDQPSSKAFEELYLRWFQFGVFCPIFRSHGHRPANEMWSYPDVEPQLIAADKLRYQLMTYIYSMAWMVSNKDYTMQRALMMDFPGDPMVRDIGDEYMFGPALLVSPVLQAGQRSREVYLPAGADWYDFWTNRRYAGGQTVFAEAPLEHIPVFVRAGSILPLDGPMEWAGQAPGAPVELRVYPGADAAFVLYQDEGDGYGYEQGRRTTTALHWTDRLGTLTIDAREGSYPGMAARQRFVVTLPTEGTRPSPKPSPWTVDYDGSAATIEPQR